MTNDELKKWIKELDIMINRIKDHNSHSSRQLKNCHRDINDLEFALKDLTQAQMWLEKCKK